jgi:transcriptional regulator with XRE-family HTH domain
MSLVWERAPYTAGSLIVLLALADWANDEGVAWPSMERLALKARIDRRSAQRIVRQLEKDGVLEIEHGGGRAKQHKYVLKMETATFCRPLCGEEKGDISDIKTATFDPERATSDAQRATFDPERATPTSPDPLVEPLEDPLDEPSVEPSGQCEYPYEWLRRALTERGLTCANVAERAAALGHKLSRAFVFELLNGKITNPGVLSIHAVADALDMPADALFRAFGGQAPPFRSKDFLVALSAYDRTAKQRKVKQSPEQRSLLFKKLTRWGEARATEALENAVTNSWRGVFEPKENGNGTYTQNNGLRRSDATERNADRLRGNIELIQELRRGAR